MSGVSGTVRSSLDGPLRWAADFVDECDPDLSRIGFTRLLGLPRDRFAGALTRHERSAHVCLLYRLGGLVGRNAVLVVVGWILIFGAVVGLSGVLGDQYDDTLSIPGTESHLGEDIVLDRFDQSGTTASVVFTASTGQITSSTNAENVQAVTDAINAVPGVSMANPLGPPPGQAEPTLSTDGSSTLGTVLFDDVVPSDRTLDEVQTASQPPAGSGLTTSIGGDAYKSTDAPSRFPELIGLLLAFVIPAVTFASLLAAGMPIVSALIGAPAAGTATTPCHGGVRTARPAPPGGPCSS